MNSAESEVGAKMSSPLSKNRFEISDCIAISELAIVKKISFSNAKFKSSMTLFYLMSTILSNSFMPAFPGATKTSNSSENIFAKYDSFALFPMIKIFFFISNLPKQYIIYNSKAIYYCSQSGIDIICRCVNIVNISEV